MASLSWCKLRNDLQKRPPYQKRQSDMSMKIQTMRKRELINGSILEFCSETLIILTILCIDIRFMKIESTLAAF